MGISAPSDVELEVCGSFKFEIFKILFRKLWKEFRKMHGMLKSYVTQPVNSCSKTYALD